MFSGVPVVFFKASYCFPNDFFPREQQIIGVKPVRIHIAGSFYASLLQTADIFDRFIIKRFDVSHVV